LACCSSRCWVLLVKALRIDEDAGSRKSLEIRRRRRSIGSTIDTSYNRYELRDGTILPGVYRTMLMYVLLALCRGWRSSKDNVRMELVISTEEDVTWLYSLCSMRSSPMRSTGRQWVRRSLFLLHVANDFEFFSFLNAILRRE